MEKSTFRLRSGLMVSKVEPSTIHRIIFILVLFTLTGCGQKQQAAKEVELVPVKVMEVKLQDMFEALDYTGNIKAEDEAVVYPKVSGKIIEKLKEDGSAITKGETVAYIDRDEIGFKFENSPVESPLTGIVGRVYVDIGQNVTIETPIALVVNMDRVKIDLDVPEKYLPRVSLEQKAKISVDAYPEEKFIGTISKISPVVDLETRSAPVEILISNPDHRLKSGMFARVHLILEEHKDVPVILKEAIIGKEPETYVYVVKGETSHKRNIELGIRQGPYFEVKSGLEKGDLVVIMGQQRVRDGITVKVERD